LKQKEESDNIATVLKGIANCDETMQKLDEDLEAGTSEDDQLSPAREINLVVSQIIFELS